MRFLSFYNWIILFFVFGSCTNEVQKQRIDFSNPDLKLENGVLMYKTKPFEGNIIRKFDTGALRSDIEYTQGRKNGYEKQWYTDGSLAIERFYTKGIKTGIHKGWWKNSNPKFVYPFNSEGAYDGKLSEWYSNGQPYRVFNYSNGNEAGPQKLWKKDGRIKANYEVRNGERFGLIGLKKCYTVTTNSNEIN
ncbi:toxin-antitoxin system YwqK family antitoxin [Aquimarina pacifica]|uniref:toxin-antitoxin system YwqK family antitoxin n=1 Tax=Aquimarina pacifica TaxID=1296415 RepID=UPI00046F3C4E|nr:hypothetical protein [Aquimarina pacifica]